MDNSPGNHRNENALFKTVNITLLLDVYGALLSERQRECLSLFYEEDLSLAEIGNKFSISRQAAHDAIRHGESQLRSYEDILGLLAKNRQRQNTVDRLRKLIGGDEQVNKLLDTLV